MSIVLSSLSSASPFSSLSPFSPLSPYNTFGQLSPLSPLSPYAPIITTTDVLLTDTLLLTSDSPNAPYVASLNLGYSKPLVGVYENLNANPTVHKRMTKYYFHKILDKWLQEDLIDVLNYLKVKDGKVDVLDNLDQYKATAADQDTTAIREKKIDFIEQYFLTKSYVNRILVEFVESTRTNWYDLYKNEYYLREVFEKKLIRRIKQAISEKKSH